MDSGQGRLVGTGTGGLVCPPSAGGRTCLALGATVLGGAYLLRVATPALGVSWPGASGGRAGLAEWSVGAWWPLIALPATVAVLVVVVLMRGRRDPASPLSLAWRTQRARLTGWTVAAVVTGALLGAVVPGVEALLGAPDPSVSGGDPSARDAWLATASTGLALVGTAFGLTVLTAPGADADRGTTRRHPSPGARCSHVVLARTTVAWLGVTWLLLVAGSALGLSLALSTGQGPGAALDVAAGVVAHAPAAWLLLAASGLMAAVGVRAVAAWLLLIVVGVAQWLGGLASPSTALVLTAVATALVVLAVACARAGEVAR